MATKATKIVKIVKKKSPTKKYILIKDVRIRKVLRKIGEKVDLTEEGRKHFKLNFYIK